MEAEQKLSAELTAADLKKCGLGTPNACFALSVGPDRIECLEIRAQQGGIITTILCNLVGIHSGWRVNIDPTDGKTWCPKGVLSNSKS